MISLEGELERDTLSLWAHVDSPADNADLMLFFAGQLHEAKAEQLEKRGRGDHDPVLAQDIADLTELCGVLADAYRWQKRRPVDPHCWRSLAWMVPLP